MKTKEEEEEARWTWLDENQRDVASAPSAGHTSSARSKPNTSAPNYAALRKWR